MRRLVLSGLAPVRCLPCLCDAEHTHLPSKYLLLEDSQNLSGNLGTLDDQLV